VTELAHEDKGQVQAGVWAVPVVEAEAGAEAVALPWAQAAIVSAQAAGQRQPINSVCLVIKSSALSAVNL